MTPLLSHGNVTPRLHDGRLEQMLYGMSRWTDVPGTPAKWSWFKRQLEQGHMLAIDPRSGVPGRWSLAPESVLGFTFWTRKPEALIEDRDLLRPYSFHIHYTLTGWHEVEHGAPKLLEGLAYLERLVETFGVERVTWRFSPVPMVEDVGERFERIARKASAFGLRAVYVAFLQTNDLVPETRSREDRERVLRQLATQSHGLTVNLCQEDRTLANRPETGSPCPHNLGVGVCEDGRRYLPTLTSSVELPKESCGCALAVDPFTINESCAMGCAYCYSADLTLAPRKRNTIKGYTSGRI